MKSLTCWRRWLILAAVLLLAAAIAVPVGIAKSKPTKGPVAFVVINVLDPPDLASGSGTFTSFRGIPAGTTTDEAEPVDEDTIRVMRVLDPGKPGGATITMEILVNLPADPGPATGTWKILSGTGKYEKLRGSGRHVDIFDPGTLTGLEAFAGKIRYVK